MLTEARARLHAGPSCVLKGAEMVTEGATWSVTEVRGEEPPGCRGFDFERFGFERCAGV